MLPPLFLYLILIAKNLTFIFFINNLSSLLSQQIISADPFNIINIEKSNIEEHDSLFFSSLIIRPFFNNQNINRWDLLVRSEFYFNSNFPNFENMGNKFIGKGAGSFASMNLSYIGKNIIFSFEPFFFISQNKEVSDINREGIFSKLNDVRYNLDMPYKYLGLRETQLYIHHNNLEY